MREAYDAVMKEIEQGRANWNSGVMQDRVHQFCEFRANLRTREKLEKTAGKEKTTSTADVNAGTRKDPPEKVTKGSKIFYCTDYNKGTCIHCDHHDGKFNGRK